MAIVLDGNEERTSICGLITVKIAKRVALAGIEGARQNEGQAEAVIAPRKARIWSQRPEKSFFLCPRVHIAFLRSLHADVIPGSRAPIGTANLQQCPSAMSVLLVCRSMLPPRISSFRVRRYGSSLCLHGKYPSPASNERWP